MKRARCAGITSMGFAAALTLAACGGGGAKSVTPTASPAAATATAAPAPTATQAATSAAPPSVIDPCTLITSLEGQPLSPGPSFSLDANTKWQLCLGGVAAGSGEKYLFRSMDGGVTWTLVSRTTLGNPTPAAGVGDLPNGNAVVQILFLDDTHGWMGLNSPGVNLFRTQDGGVTWTPVDIIPTAIPVTSIAFSDSMHGTVVTPQGTYTTSDGGVTWTQPNATPGPAPSPAASATPASGGG